MSDFIGVDISGELMVIMERLKKLPREAQDEGVETANGYIVDMMRAYPPKKTGGFVWSSDKQRIAVMIKMKKEGFPGRSQELRQGWKPVGKGFNQIVVNEVPYAVYVQGENQIVGHTTNGWQTIEQKIKTNGGKILKKFEEGVKKAIKKLKPA